MEPIALEFTVDCSPEHAFDTYTRRIGTWWPRSHSISGDAGARIALEPRAGGRIYERTPDGTEHEWGEVVTWDPPHRLTYLWHIRWDRADATEVTITFAGDAAGTAVRIVHTGWERLGADWRERNERAWLSLLTAYRAAACASLP